MKSITQEFLKNNVVGKYDNRPRIVCKDGYSISVQASEYHYCAPRINLEDGCYYSVELGYPNEYDELINKYADDKDSIDTVFGFVPTSVVDSLIEKHGGLV